MDAIIFKIKFCNRTSSTQRFESYAEGHPELNSYSGLASRGYFPPVRLVAGAFKKNLFIVIVK